MSQWRLKYTYPVTRDVGDNSGMAELNGQIAWCNSTGDEGEGKYRCALHPGDGPKTTSESTQLATFTLLADTKVHDLAVFVCDGTTFVAVATSRGLFVLSSGSCVAQYPAGDEEKEVNRVTASADGTLLFIGIPNTSFEETAEKEAKEPVAAEAAPDAHRKAFTGLAFLSTARLTQGLLQTHYYFEIKCSVHTIHSLRTASGLCVLVGSSVGLSVWSTEGKLLSGSNREGQVRSVAVNSTTMQLATLVENSNAIPKYRVYMMQAAFSSPTPPMQWITSTSWKGTPLELCFTPDNSALAVLVRPAEGAGAEPVAASSCMYFMDARRGSFVKNATMSLDDAVLSCVFTRGCMATTSTKEVKVYQYPGAAGADTGCATPSCVIQ